MVRIVNLPSVSTLANDDRLAVDSNAENNRSIDYADLYAQIRDSIRQEILDEFDLKWQENKAYAGGDKVEWQTAAGYKDTFIAVQASTGVDPATDDGAYWETQVPTGALVHAANSTLNTSTWLKVSNIGNVTLTKTSYPRLYAKLSTANSDWIINEDASTFTLVSPENRFLRISNGAQTGAWGTTQEDTVNFGTGSGAVGEFTALSALSIDEALDFLPPTGIISTFGETSVALANCSTGTSQIISGTSIRHKIDFESANTGTETRPKSILTGLFIKAS